MSFPNYSSYQSTANSDLASSSDFTRLSNSISSNVQKISQNVNIMQKLVNQLGTSADNEQMRIMLHDLQHSTHQLARETNTQLKQLSQIHQSGNTSDQKQKRMLRERLTNDFSEALKNLQVIQRTAAQKEKESVMRARANSGLNGSTEVAPNLIDLDGTSSSQQVHLQIEEHVDLNELREREEAVKRMEGDIFEVNQMFKEIASLVHEQGEVIDSIEANVETAAMRVSSGAQEVAKARDYQSKARRKTMFLLLILTVILVFLFFLFRGD